MKEKGFDSIQEAERFFLFYDSKGWMVGKNKMKNWKSAASRWISDKPKPKVITQPVKSTRESKDKRMDREIQELIQFQEQLDG